MNCLGLLLSNDQTLCPPRDKILAAPLGRTGQQHNASVAAGAAEAKMQLTISWPLVFTNLRYIIYERLHFNGTRSSDVAERPCDASCHWLFSLSWHHGNAWLMSLSHSKWYLSVRAKSLAIIVFHRNYVCISYRFWDIRRQIKSGPQNLE